MRIWVIVLLILAIIILTVLLISEKAQKKQMQIKQEELGRMLTKYVADNLDMEKQLSDIKKDYHFQQEMADEIKRMQEQSCLLKHDMKNHTLVMLSFFEENKINEARSYAGEILDKLNKMYTYVNVGNSLLNYIINNKLSRAQESGIEIKAEIENLAFDYIDGVDFSALLNNILDNAIKGALSSKEKKLEVKIGCQRGFDIITVKNSIDESVLENNPDFVSTKEEPFHGYGMKQVKQITRKYHGEIDIYEKDHKFTVSIMLASSID